MSLGFEPSRFLAMHRFFARSDESAGHQNGDAHERTAGRGETFRHKRITECVATFRRLASRSCRVLVTAAVGARAAVRAGGEPEAGMSTAEYAIGTIAACAFAALLYKVVTSSQILGLLTGLISRALQVPF